MSRNKNKSKASNIKRQKADPTANAIVSDKMASKKAAVLGTGKKGHRTLAAITTCVVLIAGGIYFIIHRMNAANSYPPAVQAQPTASASTAQFTYPVALFEDGNARHFEYNGPTGKIKYFILKSSDGIIRAAFDACDVCYRSGKGYYQEGDYMVCRNCGQKFASLKVNEVKGGCNPSPLNRSIEGNNVVIRINDILEGNQYFNFSGRI
ncbi:MAG: DUF2318 domain-containing protein [Thermodesulfobacteriota bacterium]